MPVISARVAASASTVGDTAAVLLIVTSCTWASLLKALASALAASSCAASLSAATVSCVVRISSGSASLVGAACVAKSAVGIVVGSVPTAPGIRETGRPFGSLKLLVGAVTVV